MNKGIMEQYHYGAKAYRSEAERYRCGAKAYRYRVNQYPLAL